jgi:hypothetical protein
MAHADPIIRAIAQQSRSVDEHVADQPAKGNGLAPTPDGLRPGAA